MNSSVDATRSADDEALVVVDETSFAAVEDSAVVGDRAVVEEPSAVAGVVSALSNARVASAPVVGVLAVLLSASVVSAAALTVVATASAVVTKRSCTDDVATEIVVVASSKLVGKPVAAEGVPAAIVSSSAVLVDESALVVRACDADVVLSEAGV